MVRSQKMTDQLVEAFRAALVANPSHEAVDIMLEAAERTTADDVPRSVHMPTMAALREMAKEAGNG